MEARSEVSVRRLLQRAGEENVAALIALRRAELASQDSDPADSAMDVRSNLDDLEASLARIRAAGTLALHRLDLALDGQAVMEALGCRPGRVVGEALRFLTERVLENPACNTPEGLRSLLSTWKPAGERAAVTAPS